MSATLIQLDVPGYPEVRIADRDDARTMVAILARNGIAVNLRGAPEPSDQWETAPDGEEFRVGACQGHVGCPVETHEHGCFADTGNCDHPQDHEPSGPEQA